MKISTLQKNHLFPSTISTPKDSTSSIKSIWNQRKETIGASIRDSFFLPLFNKLSSEQQEKMNQEVSFVQDFWDCSQPLNPHLPAHEKIRKHYFSKAEAFSIEVEGRQLEVQCTVIEPRFPSSEPLNVLFCFGNLSTCSNNIMGAYPFLASSVASSEKDPSTPPLRLIFFSQYNIYENGNVHKLRNLDEGGKILTALLKKIPEKVGPIAQIIAHSLGTIILSSALKYAAHEDGVLPLHLYFDRGPSSLENASKRLGSKGKVALELAKISGWDIDLGQEIQKHLSDRPEQTVYISHVMKDRYFKNIGLSQSPWLANLSEKQGFHKLCFNFTEQEYSNEAHHSFHNGFLDGHHLTPRRFDQLKNDENMADRIVTSLMQSSPLCKDKHLEWHARAGSLLSKVFGTLSSR